MKTTTENNPVEVLTQFLIDNFRNISVIEFTDGLFSNITQDDVLDCKVPDRELILDLVPLMSCVRMVSVDKEKFSCFDDIKQVTPICVGFGFTYLRINDVDDVWTIGEDMSKVERGINTLEVLVNKANELGLLTMRDDITSLRDSVRKWPNYVLTTPLPLKWSYTEKAINAYNVLITL